MAGVVATSALTSRSVVFHSGGDSPAPDHRREIDYVATRLLADHVLASAAIPAIFPAAHVEQPPIAAGWYFDGGTRLNTPIKPALKLGAERMVVVALTSLGARAPTARRRGATGRTRRGGSDPACAARRPACSRPPDAGDDQRPDACHPRRPGTQAPRALHRDCPCGARHDRQRSAPSLPSSTTATRCRRRDRWTSRSSRG